MTKKKPLKIIDNINTNMLVSKKNQLFDREDFEKGEKVTKRIM